jgi:hypothetical protein
MSRPDFGLQMNRIVRRDPTLSTQMICHGINQIIERIEEADLPLIRQGRGYFRRGTGMTVMRRREISPMAGRGRLGWDGFSGRRGRPAMMVRTLSGTLVPRGATGGVPVQAAVKQTKRRVDRIEDRLERLEGGVQELAEHTVGRDLRRDNWNDDASNWSDSEVDEWDEWTI